MRIIPKYCVGCFQRAGQLAFEAPHQLWLCRLCVDELEDLSLARQSPRRLDVYPQGSTPLPVTSLFEYQGLVRRLILRVKVDSDHVALQLLLALAQSRIAALKSLARSDIVVASPSSLWGRMRGRFDFAHHLACIASEVQNQPLIPAPYELFWRWSKRAQAGSKIQRQSTLQSRSKLARRLQKILRKHWQTRHTSRCQNMNLLLVDDVITSGATIHELHRTLMEIVPTIRTQILTFGSALDGAGGGTSINPQTTELTCEI